MSEFLLSGPTHIGDIRVRSEANEYYFKEYVNGIVKNCITEGISIGEAKERKASLAKIKKLINNKLSRSEVEEILKQYKKM